jgi:hypothetical protein
MDAVEQLHDCDKPLYDQFYRFSFWTSVEELLDVGRFAHGPITHYALPMEP